MLEIDCRKCDKCTGVSCLCYGDDANKAVKACADDGFKNYNSSDYTSGWTANFEEVSIADIAEMFDTSIEQIKEWIEDGTIECIG